jgi:GntR family transcriptional regulator
VAEPMYRQIADDLRRKIEAGELQRGGQLPTEIDLREQYDASRNTVRDAIKWLTTRGLVETRPGQGTFVTERITPFVTTLTGPPEGGDEDVYLAEVVASSRTPYTSDPRVEMQRATGNIARALHVEDGTSVVSRHQQRSIDGTPWSLQTSFYPMTLVEKGATQLIQATSIDGGAVAYLAAQFGIKQVGYRDSIAVRVPNESETSFFKVPSDGRVSVFEIYRVGFDEMGERFRLTVTVYPTDRNRLVSNVGETPPVDIQD